jgi:hypothetical protein
MSLLSDLGSVGTHIDFIIVKFSLLHISVFLRFSQEYWIDGLLFFCLIRVVLSVVFNLLLLI